MMKAWIVAVRLLVLFRTISGAALKYEDVADEFQLRCEPRDTCKSSDDDDFVFTRQNCFCDPDCVIYDDCCIDAPVNVTKVTALTSDKLIDDNIDRWHCGFVTSSGFGTYVKSVCPTYWKDEKLRSLCENDVDSSDPIAVLPVTSLDTNITYRNVFCSTCHMDYFNLRFWLPTGSCTYNPIDFGLTTLMDVINRSYFKKRANRWYLNQNSKYACRLNFPRPEIVQSRYCKPNTGSCQQNWPDDEVRRKCDLYNAYVYKKRKPGVYKNPHCAVCNGEKLSMFSCQLSYNVKADGTFQMYESEQSLAIDIPLAAKPDYCSNDMHSCTKAYVATVYDPFKRICRKLICDEAAPSTDNCVIRDTIRSAYEPVVNGSMSRGLPMGSLSFGPPAQGFTRGGPPSPFFTAPAALPLPEPESIEDLESGSGLDILDYLSTEYEVANDSNETAIVETENEIYDILKRR